MNREAVLEYDQQSPRRSRTSSFLRRHLPIAQATLDALAWIVAVTVATFARYDFQADKVSDSGVALVCALAVAGQVCFGWALGLYRRRYHYGSFDEVRSLALTVAATGLVLMVVVVSEGGSTVPRTVPFVASFSRSWPRPRFVTPSGCGRSSAGVPPRPRRAVSSSSAPVRPVPRSSAPCCAIQPARIYPSPCSTTTPASGRCVSTASASKAAATTSSPSLSAETRTRCCSPYHPPPVRRSARSPSRRSRPASTCSSFLRSRSCSAPSTIGDIRPMSEADLIERRPVEVDLASITEHLTGRRILVTGAGGSIGSELCRQLDGIRPAALVMLDRDESGLHATQLAIEGRALLDSPRLVVADIRDRGWLLEVFTRHQPEVVFHTAALKHEPLLELHPGEAWKTNVLGTQNVLDAAVASGVQLFVNLSTDKAADPTSVLGASKRITERLTADAAQRTGRPYVSVRFGNVLGSRGSVLHHLSSADHSGWPDHHHPPRRDPILHDCARGGRPPDPGGCPRRAR